MASKEQLHINSHKTVNKALIRSRATIDEGGWNILLGDSGAGAHSTPLILTSSSVLYKPPDSATVDVAITIIQGSEFHDSHTVTGSLRKSYASYIVELELDNVKKKTSAGCRGKEGQCDWDETFIFTANLSSRLNLRLYCLHANSLRSDHIIGESALGFLDIPRHENVKIELHQPLKLTDKRCVSGYITLCLTVAAAVTFSTGPVTSLNLQSLHSLSQLTKIIESLPCEELEKCSPVWCRFLSSLNIVASMAHRLSELHPPVQVTLGAVAFALKTILAQVERDEKIENLISILDDAYRYVIDTFSVEKIAFYKDTLNKLLAQTTECSYFISDYKKITQFAKRALVHLVSDADAVIKKFEDTFRDLKIELILGSSLQTAVVSFRILQKVENIENLLFLGKLEPLTNVGWDSGRTCLRSTRDAIITDLIQWASMTNKSGQIYVLEGPAGCGKSSIAHSVAQAFDQQRRLGAAIFLDDRTKGTGICSCKISSTIVSLLAHYDQNIGERIAEKIKADASLATADIGRQFPNLILSATQDLALVGPVCIIIDGLQELSSTEQLRLLTAIADNFNLLPLNFRLILTTRTSKDIAWILPGSIIHEIKFDDEGVVSDFSQYISQSLHQLFSKKLKLAGKYTLWELHDQLIQRCMGMHFWISTAHRCLLSCADGDECIILGYILSYEFPRTKEEAMDHLYHAILRCTPYPQVVHAICQTLIQSSNPLPLPDPPTFFSASSGYKPIISIRGVMQGFGFVKESRRDRNEVVSLFSVDPSLEDFLTSFRRCRGVAFYVDRLAAVPYISLDLLVSVPMELADFISNQGPAYQGSCTWFEALIVRDLLYEEAAMGSNGSDLEIANRIQYALSLRGDDVRDPNGQVVTVKTPNNENSDVWNIQRNKRADEDHQVHTVLWTEEDEEAVDESILMDETGRGLGRGFVRSLKRDDRIAVMARAQYPGWTHHIISVELEIYYSV